MYNFFSLTLCADKCLLQVGSLQLLQIYPSPDSMANSILQIWHFQWRISFIISSSPLKAKMVGALFPDLDASAPPRFLLSGESFCYALSLTFLMLHHSFNEFPKLFIFFPFFKIRHFIVSGFPVHFYIVPVSFRRQFTTLNGI